MNWEISCSEPEPFPRLRLCQYLPQGAILSTSYCTLPHHHNSIISVLPTTPTFWLNCSRNLITDILDILCRHKTASLPFQHQQVRAQLPRPRFCPPVGNEFVFERAKLHELGNAIFCNDIDVNANQAGVFSLLKPSHHHDSRNQACGWIHFIKSRKSLGS